MNSRLIRSLLGRALILLAVCLVTLAFAHTAAFGQAGRWTEPVAFDISGWFPDIFADASGRIHVAWSHSVALETNASATGRTGYDVVMYTNSDNGVSWAPINEVAAFRQVSGSEVTRPALLVDQNGYLHMTFRDIQVYYSHAPALTAHDANSWLDALPLNTDLAYFSKVAVDSKGTLHVLFTKNQPSGDCPICFHIFYRSSKDNGLIWSLETDISVIPTGASKPQMLIDSRDNIHVVWESGRGGGLGQLEEPTKVMYVVSYNGGETWSLPNEFAAPASVSNKNVAIGADQYENLVMAWAALPDGKVYYQVSVDHGLSWSSPEAIPGVWSDLLVYTGRLDTYTMATDSAGNLHLVFAGVQNQTTEDIQMLHLTWDGTAWLSPEVITTYTDGDAPEWPRLTVRNGNELHLIWFVRPADYIWAASSSFYKVWYSNSRIDAPRISQKPWPTLTATPEPTATAIQSTATVRPTPLVTPLPPGTSVKRPEEEYYTEMGQITVIARSILPALAVMAVLLVAIVVIKRR